jgi:hypothetical protein
MMDQDYEQSSKAKPEQIRYANILFAGAWVGIFLLIVTYSLYVSGIMTPHVDIQMVTQLWGSGLHEYIEVADAPVGWSWLGLLNRGDYLNFIGLAILALMTIVCYISLVPAYIRDKDWTYTIICILEILVLGFAASNIVGGGGH